MKTLFNTLKLKFIIISSLVCFSLLACSTMQATRYVPANNKGEEGYSHMKLTDNQYRVLFSGNKKTDRNAVKDYAMLHAAELTLDLGYAWFVIADSETNIETKEVNQIAPETISQTQVNSTCGIVGCAIPNASRTSTTTTYPTATTKLVKDKVVSSLLINLGKGTPSDNRQIFDARELVSNLRKDG